jgi:hypothetical protein
MSEIHFDQDGEPNEPHADCTEIRWRYFPNPGTRGAPRIVHDKRSDGAPLYTPVDISYLELRERVDGMSGYYRGDQVDQSRRLIPGVKPFYVSIAATARNAAGGGTSDELVRHLVESNTRQSETLINQLSAVMREQRKTMKETRKVMRVIATADLRELFKRFADATPIEDQDNDEEDEEQGQDASDGVAKDIKDITHQVFSAFETWMLDRAAQRADVAKTRVTVLASADSEPTPPPAAPPAPVATMAPSSPPAQSPSSPPSSAAAPTLAAAPAEIRNAVSPVPTPEQAQHLMAILNALQPAERTIARTVVHRMTNEQRAHWLGELSALTVEKAVELVRSMIPDRTKKESES